MVCEIAKPESDREFEIAVKYSVILPVCLTVLKRRTRVSESHKAGAAWLQILTSSVVVNLPLIGRYE